MYLFLKSTYCEYILEKILSTSEVGPILARIAPRPLYICMSPGNVISTAEEMKRRTRWCMPKRRLLPDLVTQHYGFWIYDDKMIAYWSRSLLLSLSSKTYVDKIINVYAYASTAATTTKTTTTRQLCILF